jgi:hypothetical protein
MDATICRRSSSLRRAARNAPRAIAPRAAAAAPVADRVGDAEPRPAGVLDVVEPVAADLVAGDDVSREAAPEMRAMRGGSGGLLEPPRGAGVLPAAGDVEDVGVGPGELERGRGLTGELGERLPGGAHGKQKPDRAPAQIQRRGHAAGQLSSIRRRRLGMPERGISGPTASGAASSSGNSGEPAVRSSREPSMSTR